MPSQTDAQQAEQKRPSEEELRGVLDALGVTGLGAGAIRAFCSEEDGAPYAVWLVDTGRDKRVLKRAKGFETEVYRCFFREKKPYVPAFLGQCEAGGETWFLTEYCPGEDLRLATREKLEKAIDALAAMQNEFWGREELYGAAVTLDRALKAAEDRGRYLRSERLERAYAAFLERFQTTPRTLCHDDLLPINLLVGERAVLIDWEYGGMLPYPLSFARLIAHAREDRSAYFYLSEADRAWAIDAYYEKLVKKHGISYGKYRSALDAFLFYEYCEWIMLGNRYDAREDERFGYCMKLAEALAPSIM